MVKDVRACLQGPLLALLRSSGARAPPPRTLRQLPSVKGKINTTVKENKPIRINKIQIKEEFEKGTCLRGCWKRDGT
jgi:hypothetical protein